MLHVDLCILTWQTSTQSYNNPAALLGLQIPEHAIQSSQFRMYCENKVFGSKPLLLDTGRLYMFAVFCQHLEVTLRHLQRCEQEALLQMS